jgi:dinuclear metal center YbgI/SA1388 family protein
MSTVSDAIAFLEEFAPPLLAESWDNVGLLVGRRDADVKTIITCLTLTPDVAQEAVGEGAQLIVSHHPVLFRGAKTITDSTSEGLTLLQLIEHGIAVYSPHTSFDSALLGVNQQLANGFGLVDVAPLRPSENAAIGGGRMGCLEKPVLLREFLGILRSAVSAEYVEYCGLPGAPVSKVAVACGSAAEFLADAVSAGCDTFVTGEASFHSALEAREKGLNLILLGHYSSERHAVERLASILGEALTDTDVFASRVEIDPLAVFLP